MQAFDSAVARGEAVLDLKQTTGTARHKRVDFGSFDGVGFPVADFHRLRIVQKTERPRAAAAGIGFIHFHVFGRAVQQLPRFFYDALNETQMAWIVIGHAIREFPRGLKSLHAQERGNIVDGNVPDVLLFKKHRIFVSERAAAGGATDDDRVEPFAGKGFDIGAREFERGLFVAEREDGRAAPIFSIPILVLH